MVFLTILSHIIPYHIMQYISWPIVILSCFFLLNDGTMCSCIVRWKFGRGEKPSTSSSSSDQKIPGWMGTPLLNVALCSIRKVCLAWHSTSMTSTFQPYWSNIDIPRTEWVGSYVIVLYSGQSILFFNQFDTPCCLAIL